jgi:hypothetical protein
MNKSKKREEAFKEDLLRDDPYYMDYISNGQKARWNSYKNYDLISPEKDMIIETKADDTNICAVIFQAILTAVSDSRTFNWYGGHTPGAKKCVPAYAINRRQLELENKDKKDKIRPSDTSSDRNQRLFGYYQPIIEKYMMDFPSRDERERIIKAKELHLEYDDEEFKKLKEKSYLFPREEDSLLLETENWRIDPSDKEKFNAYYTPWDVVDSVERMVCKWWKFTQIWDCAAGDGHLVSWFENVILSDINPIVTIHNGIVLDYLKLDKPIKEFHKNGIIIVNPSYHKKHINHLIAFAEKNKLRICIFAPASLFPQRKLPVVDGFFSTGWGNGGFGRKERGQLIMLLDFTGKSEYVDKKTLSDGTIFECVPGQDAIQTNKGPIRYGCTASDSIRVSNELNINMFATCGEHRELAGCFLSKKYQNYQVDHNGHGGRHGYGKHNPKRKSKKLNS